MSRNPKWTRDELILALDLFFRVNPLHTSEKNPEIIALSDFLNKLPIHAKSETEENFRNPSGVYMKLCNFLRFDPTYHGSGLKAGSKLDQDIWDEFANDRGNLAIIAQAIKSNAALLLAPQTVEEEQVQEDEEFAEGRVLARMHTIRERNRTLARKKKQDILDKSGNLACEACGFDFAVKYGKIGQGFAECHHNMPISELKPGAKTKLENLTILCANCHRIIHIARPWLSVQKLKSIICRS